MYSKIIEEKTNFKMTLDREYFVISKPVDVIDSYLVKIIEIK
jgi:hypothetical protein